MSNRRNDHSDEFDNTTECLDQFGRIDQYFVYRTETEDTHKILKVRRSVLPEKIWMKYYVDASLKMLVPYREI